MDLIAERLGMDPLELRLKNVLRNGDTGITGESMQTMAVAECLEGAAANVDWNALPDRWVDEEGNLCGKGIACFNKLTGTPLHHIRSGEDERERLFVHHVRQHGNGDRASPRRCPRSQPRRWGWIWKKSVWRLWIPAITPYDKTTTSSRSTFHSGNAVLEACADIKNQLCRLAALKFKVDAAEVEYTAEGYIQCRTDPDKRISYQ